MAKIYKVNTGITSINTNNEAVIRNTVYDILNQYFPNELIKVEYGSECAITGPGKSSSNCLFVNRVNYDYFRFQSNDWGHRNGESKIYISGTNSGPLCIYHIKVKNGVLMATCGENDNYKLYFKKLWYKRDNGHIYFHDFDDSTVSDEMYTRDLMVEAYPYANNPMPKAAPIIDSSKISMSKMLLGSTIQDDIYVAAVMPNASTSAQSFIVNNKEYVSISQKDGYCPAVLECV